jgi:hypothetical protein
VFKIFRVLDLNFLETHSAPPPPCFRTPHAEKHPNTHFKKKTHVRTFFGKLAQMNMHMYMRYNAPHVRRVVVIYTFFCRPSVAQQRGGGGQ